MIYESRSTGRYTVTVERTDAGQIVVLRRYPSGSWYCVENTARDDGRWITVRDAVLAARREIPDPHPHCRLVEHTCPCGCMSATPGHVAT